MSSEWSLASARQRCPQHDVSQEAPEPIERHRLCHVQVEARFRAPAPIGGSGPARQRHEPETMAQSFSDGPRHLESVEHRQAQVDQRDHRGAREGGVDAKPAVRRHLHIVALELQGLTQHLTAVLVILDDEYAWARTGDELGRSALRIRYLHEWGGNGHHLAEPRRTALAARRPQRRWPFPIVVMSCSSCTPEHGKRQGADQHMQGRVHRPLLPRLVLLEPRRRENPTRQDGLGTTLRATGEEVNRAITQQRLAAIPEAISPLERTATLVEPLPRETKRFPRRRGGRRSTRPLGRPRLP